MASEPAANLLLDTDVLTWLTDPRNPRPEWDNVVRGQILLLSFVTVGEILHATLRGRWGAKHVQAIEDRLRAYPVIPGTIGVARRYGELRRWFHDQIPENDLWIAACALAQDDPVPLATGDAHFDTIADRFPLVVIRP